MDIGFIVPVNKPSGTQFDPSGTSGASAPGFRDQINRAMRNYDDAPERDRAVEKKPVGQKKPAAAEASRNSAKTGGKADAPKKNDHSGHRYADSEAAAARKSDNTGEASEKDDPKAVLTGEDTGFYGELKDIDTSETENDYAFAFPAEEASETENPYASAPAGETPVPDDLVDSSVSSSAAAMLFPSLINSDSGFAAIMNMDAAVENAVSGAGSNAAQNINANSVPVAATEVISQMITNQAAAAQPVESAAAVVPENASSSGGEAANGAKELLETMTDDLKSANAETARPEIKELMEKALLSRNQASAQNADRNAAASLRGESARQEIPQEAKTAANAETEHSRQSAARASENDAVLIERLSAQISRPQQGAASANASENIGKTVQVAETSFHVTSGTAKAEASVPTRSVNLSDQEFVIELAGRIQSQIRGGREMIRVQLHPEELGRLEIRAESGRNGIIARIAAESLDVKKLLENNIQNLQQMLEARGLKVDRLHIVVEESADAALFADGGRYGHAGAGPRNAEVSEYSKTAGTGTESPQEDDPDDLSAEAEQRGVGFYTVG